MNDVGQLLTLRQDDSSVQVETVHAPLAKVNQDSRVGVPAVHHGGNGMPVQQRQRPSLLDHRMATARRMVAWPVINNLIVDTFEEDMRDVEEQRLTVCKSIQHLLFLSHSLSSA